MTLAIAVHDGEEANRFRDDVRQVWDVAFGRIEDVDDWRATIWDRHRARSDYRLATAHEDGELIGFAWGYTGQRGQWWSDFVVDRLGSAVAGWIGGHFEFVELAVVPTARGRGAGGLLHDALLDGLPHQRALLGTADDDSPAVHLYRSRGWLQLGKQAPGDQVMGKILDPRP